jgi:metal-dependent amidase/aminoacylase/carboxypeptidase family protein
MLTEMVAASQTEARVSKGIDDARSELRELAKQIQEHPERGLEEKFAQDYLTKFLEERGVGGIPTSFVASCDTGRPGPRIGICSEYDA